MACACLATGCEQPLVGAKLEAPASPTGYELALLSAAVDASGRTIATLRLTKDGAGVAAADVAALRLSFSLAGLADDPVSGQPAWRSYLLTGSQTLVAHPVAGPGTPAGAVLSGTRQPGSEGGGTLQDQGDGILLYHFQNLLPGTFDMGETLRVGAWLAGVTPTAATSATIDFVPGGGSPRHYQTVRDENCNGCHGLLLAHGSRSGTRLCLTCHTWQNADPDTIDPAALAGATPDTNPNPLDLGRLVHRIHRGRNLPTLYLSSSPLAAPALPSAGPLPLPFLPGRNAPQPGGKFSVVGYRSREYVFGRVVERTDNYQPARTLVEGIAFPRDLRDCAACHAGAPDEAAVHGPPSRRTCAGCHPDVWFGGGNPDPVHLAHPGGPQPDDGRCAECHLPGGGGARLYAPLAELHVPPARSPRWSGLTATIVDVQGMRPGQAPTVTFTLADRVGPVSPLGTPDPPADASSPVPRGPVSVSIVLAGRADVDYLTGNSLAASKAAAPISEPVPATTAADGAGRFTYTFQKPLPGDATGTWAVGVEARRRAAVLHYDPATDTFPWPYTGETVTEHADNPVAYVDVSSGSLGGGAPVARRTVVERARCERCHLQLDLHGGLRHNPEYCVVCHAPDATDWARRPKLPSGNVNLGTILSPTAFGTYDGVEERSVHFKVMIHRIHTGERQGSAALDALSPFAIYGFPGGSTAVNFFDDVAFPGALSRCDLCHPGTTWALESIPEGASPTVANEAPTLMHAASAAHAAGEPSLLPMAAACVSCHATGAAANHVASNTAGSEERCVTCHGLRGSKAVWKAHGVPAP
jgi:OmcA/MtrC family decaheme c-type cytochrome